MSSPLGNIIADSDIPALPEMRPLSLGHRGVLHPLFAELQPQQSELTFTNLFIWRDAYQLHLARGRCYRHLLLARGSPGLIRVPANRAEREH